MKIYRNGIVAFALIALASTAGYYYPRTLVFYPVVRLDLPDGLSIIAVLPQTGEREACERASDHFVTPFRRTCKDCKVAIAHCERQLDGLELAMHDGLPVPH